MWAILQEASWRTRTCRTLTASPCGQRRSYTARVRIRRKYSHAHRELGLLYLLDDVSSVVPVAFAQSSAPSVDRLPVSTLLIMKVVLLSNEGDERLGCIVKFILPLSYQLAPLIASELLRARPERLHVWKRQGRLG